MRNISPKNWPGSWGLKPSACDRQLDGEALVGKHHFPAGGLKHRPTCSDYSRYHHNMRIVAISDTHGLHEQLQVPAGDVLVHTGDLTGRGKLDDVARFNAWLGALPHPRKIVIAGNHDFCFEQSPRAAVAALTAATYLEDEAVTVNGLNFYGSPWQPWFCDWAFNLKRGPPLARVWARIPSNTHVLLTHTPPYQVLDRNTQGTAVGCEALAERLGDLHLHVHVFGHIHEGYGQLAAGHTLHVNASVLDEEYRVCNPPAVIDL